MNIRDALPATCPRPWPVATSHAASDHKTDFFHTVRAAINVFAKHPVPVVGCALACFAGAGIIGSLVYGMMIGDAVIRTGSHATTVVRAFNIQMLVQALIGAFTVTLGRGALTWIAMQEEARAGQVSLAGALRAALCAWRPLLFSTVLYGGLITLGLLGLSAMLRELRLDISNARSIRIGDFGNILNWTLIRAISLLPPDPGSPFSDWLASVRYNLARSLVGSYLGFDLSTVSRTPSPATIVIGLASSAALVVVDALLCLRTAAIFGARPEHGGWLVQAVRVSRTHFWRILIWRWSLRCAFVAFAVAALVLLPTLHQVLVIVPIRQMLGAGYWIHHIAQSANGVAIALVNSVLIAAGIVFEAQMYRALAASR